MTAFIQCTLEGFHRSSRIEEITCNHLQDGDRDREEVWTSPVLQLPAYQWGEDEILNEQTQTPTEVVFEHTSTEDWDQENAIVVAPEENSIPNEGTSTPDGRTDVEMGVHQSRGHASKAKEGREVSRPRFSIKTCQTFFSIFSLWAFLVLVLWTMM